MYRSDYLIRIGQIRAKLQKIAVTGMGKTREDINKDFKTHTQNKERNMEILGGTQREIEQMKAVEHQSFQTKRKINPKRDLVDQSSFEKKKKDGTLFNPTVQKKFAKKKEIDADEENERNRERNFRNTQRSIETGGT